MRWDFTWSGSTAAWLLLALALLVGAWFRFTGLDWDAGTHLHPDERHITITTAQIQWPESIAQYFDTETSPLNPYNQGIGSFVYGTLPMFVTKAAGGIADRNAYGDVYLVGRFLTALLDTLTILLVFLIARRLGGLWAGALAAALYACAVQAIQQAHFYTMDAWVTFLLRLRSGGHSDGRKKAAGTTSSALASLPAWPWQAARRGDAGSGHRRCILAARLAGDATAELAITFRLLVRFGSRVLLGGVIVYVALRLFLPYVFASGSLWDPRLNPRYTQDIETCAIWPGALRTFRRRIAGLRPITRCFLSNRCFAGDGVGASGNRVAGAALGYLAHRAARQPGFRACRGVGGSAFWIPSAQFARPGRYFLPIYPAFAVLGGVFLCWFVYQLSRGMSTTGCGALDDSHVFSRGKLAQYLIWGGNRPRHAGCPMPA